MFIIKCALPVFRYFRYLSYHCALETNIKADPYVLLCMTRTRTKCIKILQVLPHLTTRLAKDAILIPSLIQHVDATHRFGKYSEFQSCPQQANVRKKTNLRYSSNVLNIQQKNDYSCTSRISIIQFSLVKMQNRDVSNGTTTSEIGHFSISVIRFALIQTLILDIKNDVITCGNTHT